MSGLQLALGKSGSFHSDASFPSGKGPVLPTTLTPRSSIRIRWNLSLGQKREEGEEPGCGLSSLKWDWGAGRHEDTRQGAPEGLDSPRPLSVLVPFIVLDSL